MKKSLLYISLLSVGLSLNSCLDYDMPGDELSASEKAETGEVHVGNIDKIDYKRDITQEQLESAIAKLKSEGLLGRSVSAQFALRGGKENGAPGAHAYQYQYNLGPDNYAGYFVVSHRDFPYSSTTLTSTYNITNQFNGGPRGFYTTVKNTIMDLLHHPSVNDAPEIKAVNLLYYCIAAQELADISGPFTYEEDKQKSENPSIYNDMRTIYYGIKANLDTIVNCLKYFDAHRSEEYKKQINFVFKDYQTSRCTFTGDFGIFAESCWRLANSLKLRMAMHIVKVEPETARTWAEEAVASGVIESLEMTHALYPSVSGFTNPLVELFGSWNDTRMSASLECLLMSLDHPYTKMLWNKNSNVITNRNTKVDTPANDRIVGIRAGTFVGEGQSYANNHYIAYSIPKSSMMSNAPLYLVKWSEVDFLRAEGALRGWKMGGDAKFFYERGIRNASLDEPRDRQWYPEDGIKGYDDFLEDYINRENPVDYVQVDPIGDGEPWPTLTKIGVKWNDGDSQEIKLEKIITQKYIALFPLSTEAWTELRRTGYPKIFPVLNPDEGDGTIEEGDIIRRVPWVSLDPQTQADIMATGLQALGGDDFQATRLWWDVDAPNF